MELADRLVVMRAGRVVQAGTPRETYQRPRDLALARFLGDAVVVEGRIDESRPRQVDCVFGCLAIGSWHGASGACRVLIRPEDIRVQPAIEGPDGHPACTVTGCTFYGHDAMLRVHVPNLPEEVRVRVIGSGRYADGTPVRLEVVRPVSTYAR